MINVKSPREIALMKKAGEVLIEVFDRVSEIIKSGVSTYEIDALAEQIMAEHGCNFPCKGYYGYPAATCVSVNDTLIHGIPSKKIILHEGDIVSLDVVAEYKGYCADATRTYIVGVATERVHRLVDVTREAFFEGIKYVKEGNHVGDISNAIEKYCLSHGYSVVREYTGHGIGKEMHEDPMVPNYGKEDSGPLLKEGMALAIEPMVLEGKPAVRILNDDWTVKSRDGKLTCHYENTVVVTKDGCEIITLSEKEKSIYVKK